MKEVWFRGVNLGIALQRNNSFGALGTCRTSLKCIFELHWACGLPLHNVDELIIPLPIGNAAKSNSYVESVFYCEVTITCCSLLITAHSIIPVVVVECLWFF